MPYCSIDEAWGRDFGVQSEENLVNPRLGALKNKYSFTTNDKKDIYKRYSRLRKQKDVDEDTTYSSEPASTDPNSWADCDYDEGQSESATCFHHFKHLKKCTKCSKKIEELAKKYKIEGMDGENESKPIEFTIKLPSNTSELLAFFIIGITIIYVIEWIFRRRG